MSKEQTPKHRHRYTIEVRELVFVCKFGDCTAFKRKLDEDFFDDDYGVELNG